MKMNKKSVLIPLGILVFAVAFAFWSASRGADLDILYPLEPTPLAAEDVHVKTPTGVIHVGLSTSDEVKAQFPGGKTLGMSTVYADQDNGCNFTFTKHSDQLWVMQIEKSGLATNRGIKVGDPFEPDVLNAYGDNYGMVRQPGNTKDFDVAYGDDASSIIFQVRDHVVTKISLKKPPAAY